MFCKNQYIEFGVLKLSVLSVTCPLWIVYWSVFKQPNNRVIVIFLSGTKPWSLLTAYASLMGYFHIQCIQNSAAALFLQAYIYNIYIYSIFKVTFASSLYMFLKLYNFEDNYICNRNNLHINYGCFLFQLSDISYLHLGDSPETLISAGQIFRKRHWNQFTQTKPIFCWLQGDQSTDRQQTHYVFV